jgi:hypothetical protein
VRVSRHVYDLARLGTVEQAVSLVSIIQGKAMRDQIRDRQPWPVELEQAVIVAIDEVPDAKGDQFLLQELRPGIDRRLASRASEDERPFIAGRIERQVEAGISLTGVAANWRPAASSGSTIITTRPPALAIASTWNRAI